jgi:hypothetical protein
MCNQKRTLHTFHGRWLRILMEKTLEGERKVTVEKVREVAWLSIASHVLQRRTRTAISELAEGRGLARGAHQVRAAYKFQIAPELPLARCNV